MYLGIHIIFIHLLMHCLNYNSVEMHLNIHIVSMNLKIQEYYVYKSIYMYNMYSYRDKICLHLEMNILNSLCTQLDIRIVSV